MENIGAVLVVLGIVILVSWWVSVYNKEIRLRNLTDAQKDVCEANFDKMWKVIKQITKVSDDYKDAFKEIYPKIISVRSQNHKNMLTQFVGEHNPDLSTALFSQLANAIETNREMFFSNQKTLIAYRNEHKNLIENIPGCIFVFWQKPIEITIITSDYTEEVYKSGKENI